MNFASVNSMDFQDEFIHEPLLDSFGSFKCGKPLVCEGCIIFPRAFVSHTCPVVFVFFLFLKASAEKKRKMFNINLFIARENAYNRRTLLIWHNINLYSKDLHNIILLYTRRRGIQIRLLMFLCSCRVLDCVIRINYKVIWKYLSRNDGRRADALKYRYYMVSSIDFYHSALYMNVYKISFLMKFSPHCRYCYPAYFNDYVT